MKKKGFTLVELLAVIAILAILVVIAMPNVLGMFNSSKKNTFVTEVQSILKQVTTDYVQQSLGGFSSDGYIFTNGTVPKNDEGNPKYETTKLNIETNKTYFIKVNSQGAITDARVWDNSFCYSETGTDIKYQNVKSDGDASPISDYTPDATNNPCKMDQ